MVKIRFYIFDKLSILYLIKVIYLSFSNMDFSLINLPRKKRRITLLKAPHVNKKAKEHYELICYSRLLVLSNISNKQLIIFLKQIPNNIRVKLTIIN